MNIKNRPSQLMNRKPVLITSNDVIWRYVSDQKQTLMNRMKCFLHLRKSDVTQKYSKYGKPNPVWFQDMFMTFEYAQARDEREEAAAAAAASSTDNDTSNIADTPEWTTDDEMEFMPTQEVINISSDTMIIDAADKDQTTESKTWKHRRTHRRTNRQRRPSSH